jgi:hypothetical protein
VRRFIKYNLGEGLEKRSNDFAAEVAQQTQAKAAAPAAPKPEEPKKEEPKKVGRHRATDCHWLCGECCVKLMCSSGWPWWFAVSCESDVRSWLAVSASNGRCMFLPLD